MIGLAMVMMAQAAVSPAAAPPDTPAAAMTRLVALYDEVCLRAFPIDGAVDALMADKRARALTPEQVRVTFRDDPGRGWVIDDGDRTIQVMLELPPFHACSVRRDIAAEPADLSAYRALADRFEADHPAFQRGTSIDRDIVDLHVHGTTEARPLPTGGAESLMLIDQRKIDPATRSPSGAYEYRLVHQIAGPDAG